MVIDVDQSQDFMLEVGQTVILDRDPLIVRDIEPAPRCHWFLGRLNKDGQGVLYPSVVTVTLERFDGYPA